MDYINIPARLNFCGQTIFVVRSNGSQNNAGGCCCGALLVYIFWNRTRLDCWRFFDPFRSAGCHIPANYALTAIYGSYGFFTYLGNWQIIVGVAAFFSALLYLRRRWWRLMSFLIALLCGEATLQAVKFGFGSARPDLQNAILPAVGQVFRAGIHSLAWSSTAL